METKPGKVVHSQAGGHWAQQVMGGGMERIFCWLIMGHHAGLADFPADITGARALEPKMRNPETSKRILQNVPEKIKIQPAPAFPEILCPGDKQADFAFFIRMLFSCVVDADFLDTEAFIDLKKKELRQEKYPSLGDLLTNFEINMDEMCKNASSTKVNQIRSGVLEQCRNAAKKGVGVFSLTVPTGGGKTLSSLAFALRHAVRHGKRRIIKCQLIPTVYQLALN